MDAWGAPLPSLLPSKQGGGLFREEAQAMAGAGKWVLVPFESTI